MARRILKFQYYEAPDGWRWRLVSPNGKIIADSGEAYSSEQNLRRACWNLNEQILFAGRPLGMEKVNAPQPQAISN